MNILFSISSERGVLLVYMELWVLVIPRRGIHEVQKFMTYSHLHHMINLGDCEVVLKASIQVAKFNTCLPLIVRLRNYYRVRDHS